MRGVMSTLSVAIIVGMVASASANPEGTSSLRGQVSSLKKKIAESGPTMAPVAAVIRNRLGGLTGIKGIRAVTDVSCFRAGCYGVVTYASAEESFPAQRSVISTLRTWEHGIVVTGVETSSGSSSSLVVMFAPS